jgi:hypothetical protein
MKKFLLALILCMSVHAQKDFLTEDEIERVRLAQDPNDRLRLYTELARLRIDQLDQLFAKEKAGRSILIHTLLDQYSKIIEAIDIVADDALKRKLPIEEGIAVVVEAQKKMLAKLKDFEASDPKDLSRYEFVLQTAIETTEDSIEASEEDLADRARRVITQSEKEKKEREALMSAKEVEERKADAKKMSEDPNLKGRKPPTLRKKGEEIPAKKP